MKELRATHPQFGDCIVRGFVRGSNPARVLVDYPQLGLRDQEELQSELIDPTTGVPIVIDNAAGKLGATDLDALAKQDDTNLLNTDRLDARMAILALRLGQCPEKFIDQVTVGADEIRDACKWALDRSRDGRPAYIVVESPFGKGKTHALNLLAHMARKDHRAVGNVVLDGVGVSLADPMTLLRELASAIQFPPDMGIESLPERLCEKVQQGRAEALRNNGAEFLADCLRNIPRWIAEQPDAWDVVVDYLSCVLPASQAKTKLQEFNEDGERLPLPAIVANRVDERPGRCVKMLREWAQACTSLGASRGLVLMFDEADVDYANSGFGERAVQQRTAVYEGLKELAEGSAKQRAYLTIAFAITPGEANRWGEEPVEELIEGLGKKNVKHVQLRDLTRDEFVKLGVNVSGIYNKAFGQEICSAALARIKAVELIDQLADRVSDGSLPRVFIREYVERLDLLALKL